MVITRSQKRKAEDSEPETQAPIFPTRGTKNVLVKGDKRVKAARDDDDQLTLPAPQATAYRNHKVKKIILHNKKSKNQSIYPVVITFRGSQREEPEKEPIKFTFRCTLRPKSPNTKQNS
jgi:uncharacterized protein with gpF-like domain